MSENIYQCKKCSKSFTTKKGLNGHQVFYNKIMCCSTLSKKELPVSHLNHHNNAYINNTKICPQCKIKFRSHEKKFCSQSCSATFNNIKSRKKRYCLNCNIEIYNGTFCSKDCKWDHTHLQKIFSGLATSTICKKYLLKTYGHKCNHCKNTQWNKKPIPIEIEHIDGNSQNNNLSNLELICPNCHAQTPTYKSKNKGNGRHTTTQTLPRWVKLLMVPYG